MTPELEARLKAVYPSGERDQINVDACDYSAAERAHGRITFALIMLLATIDEGETLSDSPHVATFHVSQAGEAWQEWRALPIDGMIQRLQAMDHPMVHLKLKVSAIWPAFEVSYLVASLQDNGLRVAYESTVEPPTADWAFIDAAVRSACRDAGLRELHWIEDEEPVAFLKETGALWCTLGDALLGQVS